MGFFEKMFKGQQPPKAEQAQAPQEAVVQEEQIKTEEASAEGVVNENKEAKEDNKEGKSEKEAGVESKEDGPAGFEMSQALNSSLDKLVSACASGSPIDIDQALSRCGSALSEYKGNRFKDSDASISALNSFQKAINGANKNFFLGMRKNTVMLQIGVLEQTLNNLID